MNADSVLISKAADFRGARNIDQTRKGLKKNPNLNHLAEVLTEDGADSASLRLAGCMKNVARAPLKPSTQLTALLYDQSPGRLFADPRFRSGCHVAFLRHAYRIPYTRRTCGLWRFADMRRRGKNAEIADATIRIGFALGGKRR